MNKFDYEMLKCIHPFQDRAECQRVRNISRSEICNHPNENFKISVIENDTQFLLTFMLDIVRGIKESLELGKQHVIILPATMPEYAMVAQIINELNISCKHVHTFNMDEYANEDGKTAPRDWHGGFQYYMFKDFFSRIKPELAISEKQIHFPSDKNVTDYSKMIEDLGGADVCYGGIGWSGHVAFFEPHLWEEFGEDMDAYLQAGSRIVELHPLTVAQNSLYTDSGCVGDWSWCPPKAATIGPKDLANSKVVRFNAAFRLGNASWQKFITRLAAHGPVTPKVPASILQIINSELRISGALAADSETSEDSRVFF